MKKNMFVGLVIVAVLLIGGVVASADSVSSVGGTSTAAVVDPGTGGR